MLKVHFPVALWPMAVVRWGCVPVGGAFAVQVFCRLPNHCL